MLVGLDSDAVIGDFGLTRLLGPKNHLQMHQISVREIHLLGGEIFRSSDIYLKNTSICHVMTL